MSRLLINDNTPRYVEVVNKDLEVEAIFYARTIREAKTKARVYIKAQKAAMWPARRILIRLLVAAHGWSAYHRERGWLIELIYYVTSAVVKRMKFGDSSLGWKDGL